MWPLCPVERQTCCSARGAGGVRAGVAVYLLPVAVGSSPALRGVLNDWRKVKQRISYSQFQLRIATFPPNIKLETPSNPVPHL